MYCLVRIKKSLVAVLLCVVSILTMAVCVTAYAAENEKVELPIIMYHSVLKDSTYWGKYVISPDEFKKDLQFLKTNGYTAIGQKELTAYVEQGVPLPEKPILLSFDDGYYNNYLYAYPLAKQYETKIVIAPIGYWSDQYSGAEKLSGYYSHCTWEQIGEMHDSGYVEFANHTYNLHKSDGVRLGAKQLAGESAQDYEELLTADIRALQNRFLEHTGEVSGIFVYPFGAISKETSVIVDKLGFKVGLTCEEKVNTVTRDPASIKMLGRFLRTQNTPVSKLLQS